MCCILGDGWTRVITEGGGHAHGGGSGGRGNEREAAGNVGDATKERESDQEGKDIKGGGDWVNDDNTHGLKKRVIRCLLHVVFL